MSGLVTTGEKNLVLVSGRAHMDLAHAVGEEIGCGVSPVTAYDFASGEIYVVGVNPQAQGGGLGRTLTLRALAYLACAEDENGEPLRAIDLYVDADNTAAYSLYTSLGFGVATVDRMYAPAQQAEPAA